MGRTAWQIRATVSVILTKETRLFVQLMVNQFFMVSLLKLAAGSATTQQFSPKPLVRGMLHGSPKLSAKNVRHLMVNVSIRHLPVFRSSGPAVSRARFCTRQTMR